MAVLDGPSICVFVHHNGISYPKKTFNIVLHGYTVHQQYPTLLISN